MSPDDKEKQNLYENLLKQGVSRDQIEKVYRELRDKGYGEEEARRRSRAAVERPRVQPPVRERRIEEPAPLRQAAPARDVGRPPALPKPVPPRDRRAIDWLPEVPTWLRRRINRYAYRKGFLITRLLERVDDLLSVFDPAREDCVSNAFLRLLAERSGYRDANPWTLSFADNLDALRDSAVRLLGKGVWADELPAQLDDDGSDDVVKALRSREPFALEFLGEFIQPFDMLRKSLDVLEAKLEAGARVCVVEVARVVKDGCRLIVATEAVEREKLETLFDIVRDVNLTLHPGAQEAGELADAEGTFRAAYQSLRRYGHEMYPALLKMIASFYEENDTDPEKRILILSFLGLREDEILTWEGWQRKVREQREKALAEQKARELARLEKEKEEKLSARFEGTLSTLSALFADSGIERMEQGEYVLPYFVTRVFTRTALFQSRLTDIEHLSSSDVMGLVMVFHSILDDLLYSLEPYVLEKVLGRETLAGELVTLRALWSDAFRRLFEPYLDSLREYAREMEGDELFVKVFSESQRARGIEERINKLRNRAIRSFTHVIGEPDRDEGPKLYELASRLAELLADVGQLVNKDLMDAPDPVRRRLAADLGSRWFVDFIARSQTSSPDYRPVTRQVRRWIEARFRQSVLDIPQKAQIGFVEVFRGVAELYTYLLNDANSFFATAGRGVVIASSAEMEKWSREKTARGRAGSLETLQATLKEEFPRQHLDSLTGLQNKEFFLNELPRRLAKLKAQGRPVALLMIDIDHFKWINDELGHPRGDEVLKSTGELILDNVREGDLPVRYGGEEILVVVPSDLHTGIILAERLRHAQEQAIRERETSRDVHFLEGAHGGPCGTFSIGVADISGATDPSQAVEASDKALYFAKKSRNTVAFVDPSAQRSGGSPFATYAEYKQRTGRNPG